MVRKNKKLDIYPSSRYWMQEDRPSRPHSPGFEAAIITINKWFLSTIHGWAGEVSSPGMRYEPVLDFIERQIRDQRATLDAPAAAAIVLHGIITDTLSGMVTRGRHSSPRRLSSSLGT
jgi:hypothetical protein